MSNDANRITNRSRSSSATILSKLSEVLCDKPNLSKDKFVDLLLKYCKSHISSTQSSPKVAQKFKENSDIFQIQKTLVITHLNDQRLSNSPYCDLLLKVVDRNSIVSAHSCVLVALLGKKFEENLQQLIREAEEHKEAVITRPIDNYFEHSGIKNLSAKVELNFPAGFEYLVNYCYTGTFLSFPSDLYNKDDIVSVIEAMVDIPEMKEQMLEKLHEECDINQAINDMLSPITSYSELHTVEENNKVVETNANTETNLSSVVVDVDEEYDNDWQKSELSEDEDVLSTTESDSDFNAHDELDIKVSPSKPTTRSMSIPKSKMQCEICEETFPLRAQLVKHIRNEHFQETVKRKRGRPPRSTSKMIKVDIHGARAPKHRFKKKPSVAECCGEIFNNQFKLGVHILHHHSKPCVDCSECNILMPFEDLIQHYQSEHQFGPFPASSDKKPSDESQLIDYENENTLSLTLPMTPNGNLPDEPTDHSIEAEIKSSALSYNNAADLNSDIEFDSNINSADLQAFNFDLEKASSSSSSLWQKDAICVGCQVKMPVLKYIEHLQHQLDLAMNKVCTKSIALHKIHRCLLYQCQICQNIHESPEKPIRLYLLLSKHVSRYHLNNSTGNEKETCEICGTTVFKCYLPKHMKSHEHQQSGEEKKNVKVTCDICGKEITKKRISVHRRTHFERYPCSQCNKVFNRKENLFVHSRIHTGEKPYVCEICGKGFRQYIELRLHNRKHEKEGRKVAYAHQQLQFTNQQNALQVTIPQKLCVVSDANFRSIFDSNLQWQFNAKNDL